MTAFSSAYEGLPPYTLNVEWPLREVIAALRMKNRDIDVGSAPRTLILMGGTYRKSAPDQAIEYLTRALGLINDKGLIYDA